MHLHACVNSWYFKGVSWTVGFPKAKFIDLHLGSSEFRLY